MALRKGRVRPLVGRRDELLQPHPVDLRRKNSPVEAHTGIEFSAGHVAGRQSGPEGRVTNERRVHPGGPAQRARGILRRLGRGHRGRDLSDHRGVLGSQVFGLGLTDERGQRGIGRSVGRNPDLLNHPAGRAGSIATKPGQREVFAPRPRVKIHGVAERLHEAQMIVRPGEERAVRHQCQHLAIGGDAGMAQHDAQRRGGEQGRKILLRPHDRIREIKRRPHRQAISRKQIGRQADHHRSLTPERQEGGGRGKRPVGRAVDDVADDLHAGRLHAPDGFLEVVEFRLVVAQVENGWRADDERLEHRKVHRPTATAGDDVAVFEGVSIEQDGERQSGILRLQPVHRRDKLRGALVGGVLVAGNQQQRLGPGRRGAHRRDRTQQNQKNRGQAPEGFHACKIAGPAAAASLCLPAVVSRVDRAGGAGS